MHTKCRFIHCPINYLLTFWVVLVFHLRVGIVFHPTLFAASTWNTKTPFSRMICGSGWTSINLCDSFPASVLDVISVLSRNFLNWRPSCYGKEDWYLISTTALLQGLAVGTLGLLEIQTISSQTDSSELVAAVKYLCVFQWASAVAQWSQVQNFWSKSTRKTNNFQSWGKS